MNKSFAVIGLGTFGQQLCEMLAVENVNVLAVDIDEKKVNKVADFVPHTVCCDCTQEENINNLGLNHIDHVILAIGSNIQAAILVTVILKEAGVKNLTVRVNDEYYVPIMKKLGADNIINPQRAAVQSLSASLLSRSFTSFYEITNKHGVAQLKVEKNFDSGSLQEMDLRNRFGINVLLIKRQGQTLLPTMSESFEKDDEVIIFGSKSAITKIDKFFGK